MLPKLKKWLPMIVVCAVAAFAVWSVALTLTAADADEPSAKAAAGAQRTVAGDEGEHEPVPQPGWVSGNGIVEPADREVKLGADAQGLISKIDVKEGDPVKAGQTIVELLDDADRSAVAAAEAELAGAQARAKLSDANAARAKRLAASGAATTQEQDQAIYQDEIDQAAVASAQARLGQARAELDRKIVRSPIDGTVLQLIVRAGEYYNPQSSGASLATIGDLSKIRVRIDVDERQVAGLKVGQKGYVTAKAFGDRKFEGHVVEIARRMGRKNVRTDEPTERIDTKIREVVLELDDGHDLVQGLRVIGYLEPEPTRS